MVLLPAQAVFMSAAMLGQAGLAFGACMFQVPTTMSLAAKSIQRLTGNNALQ
jgi:hypothetical protein